MYLIQSVGAGGAGLNGLPKRKSQQSEMPFPKINGGGTTVEDKSLQESSTQSVMVGVKPKSHLQSILDEITGVVRLNADGDRLEVSQKAISMAKEYLY